MRSLVTVLATAFALAGALPAHADATFTVVPNGFSSWKIDNVNNPTLHLVRGQTYDFDVTATGHAFWIKTVQSTGTGNAYSSGVTGNGVVNGTLTLVVPSNAPSTLWYNCQFHGGMTGEIDITSPPMPGVTPMGVALLVLLLVGVGVQTARRRSAAS